MLLTPLLLLPLALAADPPALKASQPAEPPAASLPQTDPAPEPLMGPHPEEEELAPPPDAEHAPLPPGFVEVPNPAFPRPQALPAVVEKHKHPYRAEDLAPYFGQGKLALAKAAYDASQYGRALALLQGEGDALPVRYLRALLWLKTQSFAQAAKAMEQLARDYPAMRDRCLAHAALAQEGLHAWKEAAALYGEIASTSRLYPDARFGLARARRHLGDLDGAAEALIPVAQGAPVSWGRDAAAEALLAQADLARERHDADRERAALVTLWSVHAVSPLSKQAERRLRGVKLPIESQVARAESLIELHRNRAGMRVLEPLLPKLKLPDELACRARFDYGKALRKEREHTRAVAVLKPVAAECKSPDLRARALYVLGSSQSIIDFARGAATYEALARDFPSHPFADDALFYAADLYEKNGNPDAALARLAELTKAYPTGDFFAEALFKSFWIHKGRGETAQALQVLDRIERELKDAEESYDVERARYWRARIAEADGKQKPAADLYAALALEHPSTYYGMLGRGRLAALEPARAAAVAASSARLPDASDAWPMDAGGMAEDPHFVSGIELLRMGFGEAASTELLGVSRIGQTDEALRLLVQVLAKSGDARSAHAVARVSLRRDLSGIVRPSTRSVWELAYPNAFRPLIERYCKAYKVDPDLLQALMREESALDPKVLSWAGALGLTQLMLPTARSVAQELKLRRRITAEALLEPELNIQLGAAYLGKLLQRFRGNAAYALAGYNAGALAVERWRADHPKDELDAWVEEIPVAETRGYVKRVLRSFNTYQLLNGRSQAAPVVPRPQAGLRPASVGCVAQVADLSDPGQSDAAIFAPWLREP